MLFLPRERFVVLLCACFPFSLYRPISSFYGYVQFALFLLVLLVLRCVVLASLFFVEPEPFFYGQNRKVFS